MATRYYTEEAYEQIEKTIEEIDSQDVCEVCDFFDDLIKRIGQFLELYSVEEYETDMKSWYKLVLDSHDTAMKKVDDIFDAVESVDFEYRDIMKGALTSITEYRSALNTLRNVISGGTTLVEGRAATSKYIASGTAALNTSFDKILTKMEQGTLWDASLELMGDALKLGAGYIKCMTTQNPADYKKLGDTILATGCDLLSMGAIVIAPLSAWADSWDGHMDMTYEDYLDSRFHLLNASKKLKDTNSISDLLDNLANHMDEQLAKCPEDSSEYAKIKTLADITQGAAKNYKVIDVAVDAYGVVKDAKDMMKNFSNWRSGKYYTLEEFNAKFGENASSNGARLGSNGIEWRHKMPVIDVVKELLTDESGIAFSNWTNPEKFDGNVLKTAGTLWSYGEKFLPNPATGQAKTNEIPDVIFSKFKETKFLSDVFDLWRDTKELFVPEPVTVFPGQPAGTIS